jgi:uncharacterized protein (DUF2235 family)
MATDHRVSGSSGDDLPPGYRRLLLCFDGTWNTLESTTNVLRLYRALATVDTACRDQLAFYDEGIGTERGNSFKGGFTGNGLEANILEGYCWLVNNYKQGALLPDSLQHVKQTIPDYCSGETFSNGDQIFLIGFSRGAFTARSLSGLLNRIGIVDRHKLTLAGTGAAVKPDHPIVKQAWALYEGGAGSAGDVPKRYQQAEMAFREAHCHNVKIKCVAVWDTVGAMGIPLSAGPFFKRTREKHAFLDTRLGRVIEHAYHAVAIDEHRPDFAATLWTCPAGEVLWAKEVEQRWFPGAHANVGGGYDDDLLCERPLNWIAHKLAGLGVKYRRDRDDPPYTAKPPPEFVPDGSEYLAPVQDSFREFVGGIYPYLLKLVRQSRYRRPMLVPEDGIHQVVDPSARLKWDLDPDYRPLNLASSSRTDFASNLVSDYDLRIAQGEGQ